MEQADAKKVAFVTGAARNTGLAIARRFAREGYDVCVSSRKELDAQMAAESIMAEFPGMTVVGYAMETANVEDIRRVFGLIRKRFGRLDCFVSNAAAMGMNQNILNTTPDSFNEVMDVNVRGYFFCSQEAAKIMIEQGSGNIVLIGSVHYKGSLPSRITYVTSKGAIMAMTRSLAYELARYGIRVNSVAPGAIWSTRWGTLTPEETEQRRAPLPAGRESMPDEIANAVWFLASDQSPTVTGIDLVVDSGRSISLVPYSKEWS